MRIKNWEEFQHYKDRDPKWIKLYKKLLDDPQWHDLDAQAAKILVMLWLLASERNGELPETPVIAFRLRLPEKLINSTITKLSHWLEHLASSPLADTEHLASLEGEKEREKEREQDTHTGDTESFWESLKDNPAYKHIPLVIERGKMKAWFELPKNKHRRFTRQFALNWLNKIEAPLSISGELPACTCESRVYRGNFLKPCGEPAIAMIGKRPVCQTHKEEHDARQHHEAAAN